MSEKSQSGNYRPTEAKYKGDAKEMYVTYDLEQETRGEHSAIYPKVQRVYIAGDVNNWNVGKFTKESGKKVFGVQIEYRQGRESYERSGYSAERSDTGTQYEVPPTKVEGSASNFTKIVELPDDAQNVHFHEQQLPEKYQAALQDVR